MDGFEASGTQTQAADISALKLSEDSVECDLNFLIQFKLFNSLTRVIYVLHDCDEATSIIFPSSIVIKCKQKIMFIIS